MGNLFKDVEPYIKDIDSDHIFLEIGSERNEGSSAFLSNLATKFNTVLHSVDIDYEVQYRVANSKIIWHIAKGSEWCDSYETTVGKRIGLLYLDNFDYDWNISINNPIIKELQETYLSRYNVIMNNENCQVEHMTQIIKLTPWLGEKCTVIFDDTYKYNDCWIGKCGPAVIYLMSLGFKIAKLTEEKDSFGVILTRG